jgi:hypothetical protein
MKSFKTFILESLNKYQKSWIDETLKTDPRIEDATPTNFSDHIFGGPRSGFGEKSNNDTLTIPFEHNTEHTKPSENLHKILGMGGYKIHDWDLGLAVRSEIPEGSKARPISISKILHSNSEIQRKIVNGEISQENHNNAIKEYQTYTQIKTHKPEDLRIVISRNPHHVAEQSTNKGWRSCLTLGICPEMHRYDKNSEIRSNMERKIERETESRKKNLEAGQFYTKNIDDILGGAHVAYLIHKDDTELKNPLARISIKPYHEQTTLGKKFTIGGNLQRINIKDFNKFKKQNRHTILRSIGNIYKRREFTNSHPLIKSFSEQIDKFLLDKFPMKQDTRYMLDQTVQRDRDAQIYYG